MSSDAERLARKCDMVTAAAEEVSGLLDGLIAKHGMAADAVIAGALAHVVARMVVEVGGDAVAATVMQLVGQVSGLPSASELHLAAAPVAGRA